MTCAGPFCRWLQAARSHYRPWKWVCAGLSAVATFAGPEIPESAFAQTGYAPSQFTDPQSVFMGTPDSANGRGWGSPVSRPSPYFDYRSATPATTPTPTQMNSAPMAQYANSGGMSSPPAWSQNGSFPGGQPAYAAAPYSTGGRYATAPGMMNDPRAGSAYAGTPYFPPGPGSSVVSGGFPTPMTMGPAYANEGPAPSIGIGGHSGCTTAPQADCGCSDYANNRDNCILYTPWVSMAYLGGTTPSTGYNDLFVPLLQNQYHMLFGDIRGLYNDQAYQGSFGGGLRSRFWDSVIFGRYGYYDYMHSQGNQFQQATVGMELLAWRWEARTNGYIPLGNGSGSGSGAPGTAYLQNGLIFLQGTQQAALTGIDGEIGALVAADPTAQKELRAFVGGYYFNGANGGQDIPGISGRLEARLYDLPFLGQGSRLEMGVISSYDDTYKYQVTGLFNVRIALGRPTCPCGPSLIERRMMDRVIRRQEIVTSNNSTTTEAATANIYGTPASSIVMVHQGDDLKTIVESAPAKTVIVVDGAGGPYLLPNGVTMTQGETLVGGGSHIQVVGNSTGRIGDLLLPGSRPTLERDNTNGAVVTMATGTSVIGLDLVGGSSGIFGTDINTLCINDVHVSGTGTDGVQLINVDGLDIYDLSITNTGGQGILLQNANNTDIDGLTISHTVGSSIYYNCGTNIRIDGLTVDATGANNDAVRFHTQNKAVFTNFDIRNSDFTALRIESSTVVSFDKIKLTHIEGDGILAYQSGTFDFSHLAMTYVDGSAVVISDTALVSVNNSTFTDAHNVISYLGTVHYISGSNNVSLGQSTLSTGTTNGGGSVQFTTPNATAP